MKSCSINHKMVIKTIILASFIALFACACEETDKTPPETTIISNPSDLTNSSETVFEFECGEEECTFECKLDSEEWEICYFRDVGE